MNLENELHAALRREPPPADLAASVLRRTRRTPLWNRPTAWAIAAALAAAAVIPSAYQYRQHQRALEARDQLLTALSITRVQLEHTREKIIQNTRHRQ